MPPHHSPTSTIISYQRAETFTDQRFHLSPTRTRDFATIRPWLGGSPECIVPSPLTLPPSIHHHPTLPRNLGKQRYRSPIDSSRTNTSSFSTSEEEEVKATCIFNLESCLGEKSVLHPVCAECFERQMVRRRRLMWRWPAVLGGLLLYTGLIVGVMLVAIGWEG